MQNGNRFAFAGTGHGTEKERKIRLDGTTGVQRFLHFEAPAQLRSVHKRQLVAWGGQR